MTKFELNRVCKALADRLVRLYSIREKRFEDSLVREHQSLLTLILFLLGHFLQLLPKLLRSLEEVNIWLQRTMLLKIVHEDVEEVTIASRHLVVNPLLDCVVGHMVDHPKFIL